MLLDQVLCPAHLRRLCWLSSVRLQLRNRICRKMCQTSSSAVSLFPAVVDKYKLLLSVPTRFCWLAKEQCAWNPGCLKLFFIVLTLFYGGDTVYRFMHMFSSNFYKVMTEVNTWGKMTVLLWLRASWVHFYETCLLWQIACSTLSIQDHLYMMRSTYSSFCLVLVVFFCPRAEQYLQWTFYFCELS